MSAGITLLNGPTILAGGMLRTALPLNATSQFVQDNAGNTSALSLSTSLVGIGTATGTAKLTIKGAGATSSTNSLLVQNSAGTSLFQVQDDGNIAIFSGRLYNGVNVQKSFYIDDNTNVVSNYQAVSLRVYDGTTYASGLEVIGSGAAPKVGIGTTSPTARLQVQGAGATSATTSLLVQNSAGTSALTIKDDRSSYFNGLVGINNANPATQLDVNGNIFFTSNNFIASGNTFGVPNKIVLYNGSTGDFDITMWNAGWYIRHNANMSMAGSLNVGDNTTGTARLQVKGSGSTSATKSLVVQNSSAVSLFNIDDDGTTNININAPTTVKIGSVGGVVQFISGYNNSFQANSLSFYSAVTNIRGINAGNQGLIISKSTGLADLYPSAILAIDSTTQGFLPPRMTDAEARAIVTPANGLIVYNTTIAHLCCYQGGAWVRINHSPM